MPWRDEFTPAPAKVARPASARAARRWVVRIGLVVTMVAAVVASALTLIIRDRSARLSPLQADAERAVAAARATDARHWAAGELAEAERLLRGAMTERRLLDVSWLPAPRYEAARTGFDSAIDAATRAAAASEAARASARQAAESSVTTAADDLEHASLAARTAAVGSPHRRTLQRARLKLTEARSLLAAGAFESSTTAAVQASRLADDVRTASAARLERFDDGQQLALWQRWLGETVAWSERSGLPAIVVNKRDHQLVLYRNGRPVAHYPVELGTNWTADKTHAGDAATPEGRYRIVEKKDLGRSSYHRALLLDYPNADDRRAFAAARRAGQVPTSAGIGGAIEIHGEGDAGQDWTLGCVALRNDDIDALFTQVSEGTPVTIIGASAYDGR